VIILNGQHNKRRHCAQSYLLATHRYRFTGLEM